MAGPWFNGVFNVHRYATNYVRYAGNGPSQRIAGPNRPKGGAAFLPNDTVQAQVPGQRAEPQAPFKILVNCGGPAHGDYVADPAPQRGRVKDLEAYWQEWGRAWFGPEGGAQAGKALQGFDGQSVAIFHLIEASCPD